LRNNEGKLTIHDNHERKELTADELEVFEQPPGTEGKDERPGTCPKIEIIKSTY
jgi:hypothetical protein